LKKTPCIIFFILALITSLGWQNIFGGAIHRTTNDKAGKVSPFPISGTADQKIANALPLHLLQE
jgi:hypothetical protein